MNPPSTEAQFQREIDSLPFSGSHYLCPIEILPAVGDYFGGTIGSAPVIVCRSAANEITAFSGTCIHRGAVIAEGQGSTSSFACPYHGWRYDLRGSLIQCAPCLGEVPGALPDVQVQVLDPLVFVGGSPANQRPKALSFIETFLDGYDARDVQHSATREYVAEANWKLVIENFLECYHCAFVHRSTLGARVDLDAYEIEVGEGFCIHHIRPTTSTAGSEDSMISNERKVVYIFPWCAISIGRESIVTFNVIPVAPDRSRIVRDFYGSGIDTHTLDYYDKVMQEDVEILKNVQKGRGSPLFGRGRFASEAESAVRGFVNDYERWLNADQEKTPPDFIR